jgi:hypothetical protein
MTVFALFMYRRLHVASQSVILTLHHSTGLTSRISRLVTLTVPSTQDKHVLNFPQCNTIRGFSISASWCNVTVEETSVHFRVNNSKPASEILANLSAEDAKRLKVLRLEYDVLLSSGVRVPSNMTDDNWLKILRDFATIHARKNYYSYLFKREKTIENDKKKAEVRRAVHQSRLERIEEMKQDENYLPKNTMHLKILDNTVNKWYRNNLFYSLINGPHLIFDLAFEAAMTELELNDLARQIQSSHGVNKVDREPFHFHMCNMAPDGVVAKKLSSLIPNFDQMPITVTSEHYTSCYPASQLIYLSPNAPAVMTQFEHDAVYIIGGIVDKAREDPLTYAKAKKEKIRTVRFPLDYYVR